MSPSISVLLCTRNRPAKLPRAIEYILASSYRNFELVVVDQSTNDLSRKVVQSFDDPRIVYVSTDTVGLSRSRNIAVRAASAELTAFTDDDCLCDPDWLSTIVSEYERDPKVMGVTGRVVGYGEGTSDMFCPSTIDCRERRAVDGPIVPQVVLGSGNNMSFRMEVFRRIGLFVETLGAGTPMKSGEDTEFVFRALREHMKIVYAPAALVYHDNWMPMTQYHVLARDYLLGGSAVLSKFALHADRVAFVELLRTAWHIVRHKKGAGSVPRAMASFLVGCVIGVGYRFSAPPTLSATG